MATKSVVRTKGAAKTAKKPARAATAKPSKTTARKRPAAAPSKRSSPSPNSAPTSAQSPARRVSTSSRTSAQSGRAGSREFALDKLHQVALQATNLDEAVNFYQNVLGLRLLTRFDPPGLAFFEMGGFRLMLSATASEATLYFRGTDISNAVKKLKKRGVSFLQPPVKIHKDEAGEFGKKGTEEWMAFFKDPSGNLLALTELR